MEYVFSGPIGQNFVISDKQKVKLKNEIINLLTDKFNGERCFFKIKSDDCLGLIATEACLGFIDRCHVEEFKFMFICTYTDDFSLLPENVQNYYKQTIADLKLRNQRCVTDTTNGLVVRSYKKEGRLDMYDNYHRIMYSNNADFYITYYDKNTCKDKDFLKDIHKYWFKTEKCFNFYQIINKTYDAPKMKGVRKRKSSSKYYYRIKCTLPNGTPINIEKGSFLTEALAVKARREHLIALTTQDCENSDRTVDDVFWEFIDFTCNHKPSLRKKYISYYNSKIRPWFDGISISDTTLQLNKLFECLYNYEFNDNRTKDKKRYLSLSYIQGLRAMLFNFFDYAYNQKLIRNHPMYQIKDVVIWADRNKKKKEH